MASFVIAALGALVGEALASGNTTAPPDHGGGVHIAKIEWEHVKTPFLVTVFLVVAVFARIIYHRPGRITERFPESCVIILLGVIVGLLVWAVDSRSDVKFDVDTFFLYILPPIIFEAGFFVNNKRFFSNIGAILLFAILGTLINTFLIGGALYGLAQANMFGFSLTFVESCVFSSLISAVDPVAVLAVFEEVHVDATLHVIVLGESILNDAVSVVLYRTFVAFTAQPEITGTDVGKGVASFFVVGICGTLIGVIIALLGAFTTRFTQHVPVMEPMLILSFGYLAYLCAEVFELSGILSILFAAMILRHYSQHNIQPESLTATSYSVKMLAMITESIVFMFLGISLVSEDHAWNGLFIVFTLIFCFVFRVFSTIILTAIANRFRVVKIDRSDQFVLSYGGLRGAVAFSLAFVLDEQSIPARNIFVSTTLVVILFTVFIQGTTIRPLLDLLNIKRESEHHESLAERILPKPLHHVTAAMNALYGNTTANKGILTWFRRIDSKYLKPILEKRVVTESDQLMSKLDELLHQQMMSDIKASHSVGKFPAGLSVEQSHAIRRSVNAQSHSVEETVRNRSDQTLTDRTYSMQTLDAHEQAAASESAHLLSASHAGHHALAARALSHNREAVSHFHSGQSQSKGGNDMEMSSSGVRASSASMVRNVSALDLLLLAAPKRDTFVDVESAEGGSMDGTAVDLTDEITADRSSTTTTAAAAVPSASSELSDDHAFRLGRKRYALTRPAESQQERRDNNTLQLVTMLMHRQRLAQQQQTVLAPDRSSYNTSHHQQAGTSSTSTSSSHHHHHHASSAASAAGVAADEKRRHFASSKHHRPSSTASHRNSSIASNTSTDHSVAINASTATPTPATTPAITPAFTPIGPSTNVSGETTRSVSPSVTSASDLSTVASFAALVPPSTTTELIPSSSASSMISDRRPNLSPLILPPSSTPIDSNSRIASPQPPPSATPSLERSEKKRHHHHHHHHHHRHHDQSKRHSAQPPPSTTNPSSSSSAAARDNAIPSRHLHAALTPVDAAPLDELSAPSSTTSVAVDEVVRSSRAHNVHNTSSGHHHHSSSSSSRHRPQSAVPLSSSNALSSFTSTDGAVSPTLASRHLHAAPALDSAPLDELLHLVHDVQALVIDEAVRSTPARNINYGAPAHHHHSGSSSAEHSSQRHHSRHRPQSAMPLGASTSSHQQDYHHHHHSGNSSSSARHHQHRDSSLSNSSAMGTATTSTATAEAASSSHHHHHHHHHRSRSRSRPNSSLDTPTSTAPFSSTLGPLSANSSAANTTSNSPVPESSSPDTSNPMAPPLTTPTSSTSTKRTSDMPRPASINANLADHHLTSDELRAAGHAALLSHTLASDDTVKNRLLSGVFRFGRSNRPGSFTNPRTGSLRSSTIDTSTLSDHRAKKSGLRPISTTSSTSSSTAPAPSALRRSSSSGRLAGRSSSLVPPQPTQAPPADAKPRTPPPSPVNIEERL